MAQCEDTLSLRLGTCIRSRFGPKCPQKCAYARSAVLEFILSLCKDCACSWHSAEAFSRANRRRRNIHVLLQVYSTNTNFLIVNTDIGGQTLNIPEFYKTSQLGSWLSNRTSRFLSPSQIRIQQALRSETTETRVGSF